MIYKCKMCGGELEIIQNDSICVCPYCNSKQTLPKLQSEQIISLYKRANALRSNNEFDKASAIYENILSLDDKDSEAYWSLVLCRYGITYVEEKSTGKMIPTINRIQYSSVLKDFDYLNAIKYSTSNQREIYEREAKIIDDIQKRALAISHNEKPYDVFICYKETDENGKRTRDSAMAFDIYDMLTRNGYRVFFSRVSLKDKLGESYEPYIYSAINSAKVMVVVGTKNEYFNSPWVKNEWGRFLSLIINGADKVIIPAYAYMDPYDLPEQLLHLQSLDLSAIGSTQDLLIAIRKLIPQGKKHNKSRVISRKRSEKNKSFLIYAALALIVSIALMLLITLREKNGTNNLSTNNTLQSVSSVTTENDELIVSSSIAKTETSSISSSVSSIVARPTSSAVSSKPQTVTSLPTVSSNVPFDVYASAPKWTYYIDRSKPVPLQPAVENTYFNNAMFVGDSLTTGIDLYGVMNNTTVIAKTGINTNTIITSKAIKVSGVNVTFLEAMKRHNPKYIYIMLGSNGIHFQSKSKLISGYSEFIGGVKNQHPKAKIYIQSILPVTAKKQASNSAFANSKINDYNKAILELAYNKGVYYVNVAEALKDANGNLSTTFDGGDGMHLNKKGYYVWIEYLKRHTVFEGTIPSEDISTSSKGNSIVRPESSSSDSVSNTTTTTSQVNPV